MKISDIEIVDDAHLRVICEDETVVLSGKRGSGTRADEPDFTVDGPAARRQRPAAFEDHAYVRWLQMLPETARKHGVSVEVTDW